MLVREGLGRSFALAVTLAAALVWSALRLREGTVVENLLATQAAEALWQRPELASPGTTSDLSNLRHQPLTYATRQPYAAPAPVMALAPPPPSYRLTGTLITPRRPASAMLVPAAGDAAARRVKPGDDLDGWKVEAVEANRVILTYGEQSIEIARTRDGGSNAGISRVALGSRGTPASGGTLAAAGTGAATEGRLLSAVGNAQASAAPRGKAALFDRPRLYRPPPQ